MEYLLYKEAKPKLDQGTINRLAGAAGGGALGYLLTRYGLGIKGVGAGLTGAGAGATLGAIGGGYLSDYGKQRAEQTELDSVQKEKLEKRVTEPLIDTVRRNTFNAKTGLATAGAGIYGASTGSDALNKDLQRRVADLDTKVSAAAGDATAEAALKNKKYYSDVLSDLRTKRGDSPLLREMSKNAPSSTRRAAIVRGKRGGKFAALMWLLSAGGQTLLEKEVYNPRREKALNEGK
jgi:hypothetical protein